MKIHTENRSVKVEGLTEDNEQRAFSIKADAKAFKILSSTIYTHKIRAIIRELVCNAWDAHQDAKRQDKPIEVHLPTTLEPWFEVKDYGTGLSQENVLRLFSTYFDSTKSKKNNVIGAFGIGSKSPFSYVDSFIVESRYKGDKYSYNAFIGKDGAPSIVLLGKEQLSDGEVSGITIKMNCSSKDNQEFLHEARAVLPIFENPHVVVSGKDYREHRPNIEYTNDHVDIYSNTISNGHVMALMGNVIYPIPTNILDTYYIRNEQKYTAFKYIMKSYSKGYIFKFKIGELEVAPSREQLSLTPETTKLIVERMTEGIRIYEEELKDKFKGIRFPWEYLNRLDENTQDFFDLPYPQFKNWTVDSFSTSVSEEIRNRIHKHSTNYSNNIVDELRPHIDSQANVHSRISRKGMRYYPVKNTSYVIPKDNQNLLYQRKSNEINKLPVILLLHGNKESLESTQAKYLYFLRSQAMQGNRVFCVKLPYVDKEYVRAFKRRMLHLPESQYFWFKDLPQPTEDQLKEVGLKDADVVPKTKEAAKYYVYRLLEKQGDWILNTADRVVDLKEVEEFEDRKKIYYVNAAKFREDLKKPESEGGRRLVCDLWDSMKNTNTEYEVFALCERHFDQAQGDNTGIYVPAEELFRELTLKCINKIKYPVKWLQSYASGYKGFGSLTTYSGFNLLTYTSKHKELNTLLRLLVEVQDYKNYSPTYRNEQSIDYLFTYGESIGVDSSEKQKILDKLEKVRQDTEEFLDKFLKKYPLFNLMTDSTQKTVELMETYIETIDELNKLKG